MRVWKCFAFISHFRQWQCLVLVYYSHIHWDSISNFVVCYRSEMVVCVSISKSCMSTTGSKKRKIPACKSNVTLVVRMFYFWSSILKSLDCVCLLIIFVECQVCILKTLISRWDAFISKCHAMLQFLQVLCWRYKRCNSKDDIFGWCHIVANVFL